jgi:eukaryotic-like serine/threonine-protein kinase
VTPERWRQISAVFNAAKQRDPADHAAFVVGACAGDDALRREVLALLRAHQDGAGFGSSPLIQSSQLQSGSSFCGYRIESLLGAGGMGEVYRARDTKLDRSVAIKILPESFAHDPERLARFEREAKTLAALNHPNIAIIYGFQEEQGIQALVMELIEGPTLADRIAQRAIPVAEALPIAKQIAEALEAAHERGIIHRDLKPANINVRPDGTVKILDFGLAKALEPTSARAIDAIASPTTTSPARMTGVGVLLGTAAYMSPEQARGRDADKRSDVWAFGCVLYETLTGKRCFDGKDMADTLASVLTKEPDWDVLPRDMPPLIANLLRRCLVKDPGRRAGDVAAALFAIDEAAIGPAQHESIPAIVRRQTLWQRIATHGLPALVAAAAAAGGMWLAMGRPESPRVSRLAVNTTPATALWIDGNDRDLAITPDGSLVVYVGNRGQDLFLRQLDALEPVRLFTGAPRGLFMSPDGSWVGFVDASTVMKKASLTGGPTVPIATLDGGSRGAAWTPDDTIVFATFGLTTGLQQVSAAGGRPTVLTRPDRARGEEDHAWPELLPGGRTVLFTILPTTGGIDASEIAVFDRQTGTKKVIIRGGSHAHYVRGGHLVYAAANGLRAVAFDPLALETRGAPVQVVPEVVTTTSYPSGGVDAVIAGNGTLAYISGVAGPRTMVWVDRRGRETPIARLPPRPYAFPRISPDGGRVVVFANDQEADIWVWDIVRLTLSPLTFNPGIDNYPVWTRDGARLLFGSAQEGSWHLFSQAADGTGAVERLTSSLYPQAPTGVTPDGTRVIFHETVPTTGLDVMQMELTGSHTVTPLVQSPSNERNGIVSPDGRWLAYEANDRGQFEIYVRPYPNVNDGYWQVSTDGGERPLWSRDARELFYVSPAGAILGVGVEPGTSWARTTASTVVKEGYMTAMPSFLGRHYDISPDGQRFLVLKATSEPNATPPQLIVVQQFDEELKRLVPSR